MEPSSIFKNILKSVEDSNLNYKMTKTNFSAVISLKCSFVKRFGTNKNLEVCVNETEKVDTKLRTQNL